MKMKCSKCPGYYKVVETRTNPEHDEVYRKSRCPDCGNVIFTIEYEVEMNEEMDKTWKNCARERFIHQYEKRKVQNKYRTI